MSFVWNKKGELYVFGGNYQNQLGIDGEVMYKKPQLVETFVKEKIKKVVSGSTGTFILTKSNNLYFCGTKDEVVLQKTPVLEKFFTGKRIRDVYGSHFHWFIDTEEGLFAMGMNDNYQLGVPELEPLEFQDYIENTFFKNQKIESISCGFQFTLFLVDGVVYSCGENDGMLGKISGNTRVPTEIKFFEDKKVIQISTGSSHSLILTDDKKVYGFGYNHHSQLGFETNRKVITEPTLIDHFKDVRIQKVYGSYYFSLFLTDGNLFSCGENKHGQCGVGHRKKVEVITQIDFVNNEIRTVVPYSNHVLFLTKSRELYGFGKNTIGELGLGNSKDELYPVELKFFSGKEVIIDSEEEFDYPFNHILHFHPEVNSFEKWSRFFPFIEYHFE